MRGLWRPALGVTLAMFNLGIFLLAAIPPTTLKPPALFIMVLAGISFVGVLTHLIPEFRLPGEQWAYVISGFTGAIALLAYVAIRSTVPDTYFYSVCAFLLSGTTCSYAAHLADGGNHVDRSG